jgi:hypothetical protein
MLLIVIFIYIHTFNLVAAVAAATSPSDELKDGQSSDEVPALLPEELIRRLTFWNDNLTF